MEKEKKKLLIDVMLILIIALLVLVTILNYSMYVNEKRRDEITKVSHVNQATFDNTFKGLVYPIAYSNVFEQYKGEYSLEEMLNSTNKLVTETIPEYYRKYKSKELEDVNQYYNRASNIEEIRKKLGITTINTFTNFMNKIRKIKGNELTIDSLIFDKNTIVNNINGTKTVLVIKYKDNEKIELNVLIRNKKNSDEIVLEVCD